MNSIFARAYHQSNISRYFSIKVPRCYKAIIAHIFKLIRDDNMCLQVLMEIQAIILHLVSNCELAFRYYRMKYFERHKTLYFDVLSETEDCS